MAIFSIIITYYILLEKKLERCYNAISIIKNGEKMKTAFRNIGWFFKQEYKMYIFVGINLIILAFISVIPARILGNAIDEIVSGSLTLKVLLMLIGQLAFITIFRYIVNWIYHYYINYLGHKLSYKLREKYIAHLFDLDVSVYGRYTKGDLIARATNDLQNL